jgi:hypothetical protein
LPSTEWLSRLTYASKRLNKACAIANIEALFELKNAKAILQSNRDKLPDTPPVQHSLLPQDHINIRGAKSFH